MKKKFQKPEQITSEMMNGCREYFVGNKKIIGLTGRGETRYGNLYHRGKVYWKRFRFNSVPRLHDELNPDFEFNEFADLEVELIVSELKLKVWVSVSKLPDTVKVYADIFKFEKSEY